MPYFSKIVFDMNTLSAQDRVEFGFGLQVQHQLIWKAFGDRGDRARDFLFRANATSDKIVFWALSERTPDDWDGKFCVHTKPYTPRLEPGQRLGFDLRVNATVSARLDGKRGTRHDAVNHHIKQLDPETRAATNRQDMLLDVATAWMSKKREQCGFSIDANRLQVNDYTRHEFKKKPTHRHSIVLNTFDLSGVLTVENPEVFAKRLTSGIGTAKAYGNGLFLLRPV